MQYKWRIILILSVIAIICVATACGKSNTNTQTGNTTGGTTQGGGAATESANAEALVKANCVSCHGGNLDGMGDSKKNLQKVGAKLSKEEIANTITNGRNGMPAFKGRLKDTEIATIADWLAAKK
ncbi:c-type cytochrome [Paenibacillus sp. LMG 31456]|uniref:C-type cytochrome n=1 Tax=Paenibacillus foliorum TaxID=2654974 RepID=A0A972K1Z2_9BACL|nr:cytochrome c [Paenibacillus foliorum]NOU93307.1 c-type cytochrome [Paenibacillus foliorum]